MHGRITYTLCRIQYKDLRALKTTQATEMYVAIRFKEPISPHSIFLLFFMGGEDIAVLVPIRGLSTGVE
jgi:hypothetical protein